MKKYFILLLPVIGITAMLSAPNDAVAAGSQALDFCLRSVIPSLLPFLVFSSIAVSTGLADLCAKIFGKIMHPLFGVPGECATAFILGLISGFPIGAKTAAELYENRKCSKNHAEKLLTFCNGASPAFIIGTVGGVLWNDKKIGFILFAAQTVTLIITGIVFGKTKNVSEDPIENDCIKRKKQEPFLSAVVSSVMGSAITALYITAFIVFFAVISQMLMHFGIIPAIAEFISRLFNGTGITQNDIETVLCGFVEFSTGVKKAAEETGLKQAVITALILGWSGLSVHCQVAASVLPLGISVKKYILAKAFSSVLFAVTTFAFYILFNR